MFLDDGDMLAMFVDVTVCVDTNSNKLGISEADSVEADLSHRRGLFVSASCRRKALLTGLVCGKSAAAPESDIQRSESLKPRKVCRPRVAGR